MPSRKLAAQKAPARKAPARKAPTTKAPAKKAPAKKAVRSREERWELRLYVAGETPRSVEAFARLKRICDEHLRDRYSIEVIDLATSPALAVGDQIVAIPTVVRRLPRPVKKIIGDLSNVERVIVGLDLTHTTTTRSKTTAS